MRRETARALRGSRGTGIESAYRSRQAADALQLADVSELTAGLLKVPSVSSDDVTDVRAKAQIADVRRTMTARPSPAKRYHMRTRALCDPNCTNYCMWPSMGV